MSSRRTALAYCAAAALAALPNAGCSAGHKHASNPHCIPDAEPSDEACSADAGRDAGAVRDTTDSGTQTGDAKLLDAGRRDAAPAPDSSDSPAPAVDAGQPEPKTDSKPRPTACMPTPNPQLAEISISARAFVADPKRRRIYAIVPSTAATYANELVTIDPTQPDRVLDHVPVGEDPGVLAIAGDASTLWVGLWGSHQIRRVDLSGMTPAPGARYLIGSDGSSIDAGQIVVLEGAPNSIAISAYQREQSPSFVAALVMDDGVVRSTRLTDLSAASRLTSGPPGYLFGFDSQTTAFEFSAISVDGSGLRLLFSSPSLVQGFYNDIVYDPDGFVYATSGEILDVSDPRSPKRAGVFPYSGALAPVAHSDIVLMVSPRDAMSGPLVLRRLDTSTFSQLDVRTISDAAQSFGFVQQAAVLGADTLVVLAGASPDNSAKLYIWRDACLVEPPQPTAADLTPTKHGELLQIPVAARALAADPARHHLYAAMDDRAETLPNRLLTIDANANQANVIHSMPVGSEPTTLAIAQDNSSLWIGLRGSYSVRRADLSAGETPSIAEQHALPPLSDRHLAAACAIVALPSANRSIAVARDRLDQMPNYAGIVILDDGSPRATLEHLDVTALALGPDGVVYSNGLFDGFQATEVGASSLTPHPATTGLLSYDIPDPKLLYDSDGFVYATTGDIVGVSRALEPEPRGRFPYAGALWPQPNSDLVLMVSPGRGSGGPLVLRTLDTATRTQLSERVIGDAQDKFDFVSDLVVLPPDVLAFIAGNHTDAGSNIYVLHDPDLLVPPTLPSPSIVPDTQAGLSDFSIDAQELIADPQRGRVYISVGDRDPHFANQLVSVDVAQLVVADHVPIGSKPAALAISDDSSTLWVGLTGSYEVRRVDLRNGMLAAAEQQRMPLGYTDQFAAARSMVVLPATTNSLALVLEYPSSGGAQFAGLTVLDNGIARSSRTSAVASLTRLVLGAQGFIYGYDDLSTGAEFDTLVVDSTGLVQRATAAQLVSGMDTQLVFDPDGFVYASSGSIVDVTNAATAEAAGSFPFSGGIWGVPNSPNVLMVSAGDTGQLILRRLDTGTHTQSSEQVISSAQTYAPVSRLVHVLPGTLAFIARPLSGEPNHLFVYHDSSAVP